MAKDSKAKLAYDTQYESTPEQKKKRAMRNAARRALEKEGKVTKGDGKDVDHKTPLNSGGTNSKTNLQVVSETTNRGWRKGQSGYKPK